jgi:hypothetical protein
MLKFVYIFKEYSAPVRYLYFSSYGTEFCERFIVGEMDKQRRLLLKPFLLKNEGLKNNIL